MNKNTYFRHLVAKFMGRQVDFPLTQDVNIVIDPRLEA